MYSTMVQLFEERADQYPSFVYQMEKDSKGKFISYTYEEVRKKVHALASGLAELGVKRGDKVGLLSDNRAFWMIADLAIMALGAADVPRGRDSMDHEVAFIYSETECSVIFAENKEQLLKVLSVKDKLPHLKYIVLMDSAPVIIENPGVEILYEEELIERNLGKDDSFVLGEIAKGESEDIATIIYTSGTTGTAKGVMLTHKNFITLTSSIPSVSYPVQPAQRWLSVLPVWHSFERIIQYIIVDLAATIIYSKPIGKIMLNDIARTNPHWMGSVPRIWEMVKSGVEAHIKKQSAFKRKAFSFFMAVGYAYHHYMDMFKGCVKSFKKRSRFLDILRSSIPLLVLAPLYKLGDKLVYNQVKQKLGSSFIGGISGGGALSESVNNFFRVIGINLMEGYGLTETAPVIGIRYWNRRVIGAMSPYGSDVRISIRNEEGKECKPGEKGVLHIKGSQVMKGYYKRPDLTEKIIDKEGFLNTGDLAVWTYYGEYSIVGRAKDTIVLSGGENVEPTPIEAAINESPYIAMSAVVGQDKKYLGALVTLDANAVEHYLKDNHILYSDRKELASLAEVQTLIEQEIGERVSAKTGFKSFERVVKCRVLPNNFEIGRELSAKQEIKRFVIQDIYAEEIESLY